MKLEEKLVIIGKLCDIAESHPVIAQMVYNLIQEFTFKHEEIPSRIVEIGKLKGKLYAVKELKELKGLGIIEAKHQLEDYFAKNGLKFCIPQ